jgi:hypothetical protein
VLLSYAVIPGHLLIQDRALDHREIPEKAGSQKPGEND